MAKNGFSDFSWAYWQALRTFLKEFRKTYGINLRFDSFSQIKIVPLRVEKCSFDIMQDDVKCRTLLVSKSLPVKKKTFASCLNSAIKTILYVLPRVWSGFSLCRRNRRFPWGSCSFSGCTWQAGSILSLCRPDVPCISLIWPVERAAAGCCWWKTLFCGVPTWPFPSLSTSPRDCPVPGFHHSEWRHRRTPDRWNNKMSGNPF